MGFNKRLKWRLKGLDFRRQRQMKQAAMMTKNRTVKTAIKARIRTHNLMPKNEVCFDNLVSIDDVL
jgi:hypothetical protein